jgi:outer membrane protein assembly factor BamB
VLFTGELVVTGTDVGEGHVYAFEVGTGDVRWMLRAGRGVATDILRYGDDIFAATLEDSLLCIDLATGVLKWSFGTGAEVSERITMGSTPAIAEGVLCFGGLDGFAYAFEPRTGEELWRVPLESQIVTSVLALDDAFLTATADGHVYRIDPLSARIEAKLRVGGRLRGELVPAGDRIIAVRAADAWEASLIAFDRGLERVIWTADPPAGAKWTTARPFLHDSWVLVGGPAGRIHGISILDGSIAWDATVDGDREWKKDDGIRVFGRHDGVLFIGTIRGMLYALETG